MIGAFQASALAMGIVTAKAIPLPILMKLIPIPFTTGSSRASNHSAVIAVATGIIIAVPRAKHALKNKRGKYPEVKKANTPIARRNEPIVSILFRPNRLTSVLTGRETAAMASGAMEAYHPATLRLRSYSWIIRGNKGPAEAHNMPTDIRTRIIDMKITNR